ncbi:hypothetical protein DL96DRAFT_1015236 [Flagelloscypha sp. PMI_526]|nr:hypothetical protein DL96DRAFT_1015236 [Flagelloscypha sp. PMI_526]
MKFSLPLLPTLMGTLILGASEAVAQLLWHNVSGTILARNNCTTPTRQLFHISTALDPVEIESELGYDYHGVNETTTVVFSAHSETKDDSLFNPFLETEHESPIKPIFDGLWSVNRSSPCLAKFDCYGVIPSQPGAPSVSYVYSGLDSCV